MLKIKTVPSPPGLNRNSDISNFLAQLAKYYQSSDEPQAGYKSRQFSEAADKIAKSNIVISSGQVARQNFSGIGPSMVVEIDQFLTTGTSQRMQKLSNKYGPDRQKVIDMLQGVYGIGAKTAESFYQQGVRKLEDLSQLSLTGPQKIGYYFYHHFQQRIPRAEIDLIYRYLQGVFNQLDSTLEWQIAGSYRRGTKDSGDIDVIIKSKSGLSFDQVIQSLIQTGLIPQVPNVGSAILARGQHKFLGVVQIPGRPARRLDLLWINEEQYPFGLLYFTGSQYFNIVLRELALKQGWTLNEYRIMDKATGQLIHKLDGSPIKTEEDIFQRFGLSYLPPTERNYTAALAEQFLVQIGLRQN